jgi:hypothetical protein
MLSKSGRSLETLHLEMVDDLEIMDTGASVVSAAFMLEMPAEGYILLVSESHH